MVKVVAGGHRTVDGRALHMQRPCRESTALSMARCNSNGRGCAALLMACHDGNGRGDAVLSTVAHYNSKGSGGRGAELSMVRCCKDGGGHPDTGNLTQDDNMQDNHLSACQQQMDKGQPTCNRRG